MAGFLGLTRRKRHERTGFELYTSAVGAARDPVLYTELGVPDTLDGRFDMIGLYAFLVIERLTQEPEPGPDVAQAVFDAMFSDMDINLREMGVGDLSVGKKVKAMWEAFHGRAAAYAPALRAHDPQALQAALRRNVWREQDGGRDRGAPGQDTRAQDRPGQAVTAHAMSGAISLARLAFAQHAFLAGQPLDALASGVVRFLPAAEAAR